MQEHSLHRDRSAITLNDRGSAITLNDRGEIQWHANSPHLDINMCASIQNLSYAGCADLRGPAQIRMPWDAGSVRVTILRDFSSLSRSARPLTPLHYCGQLQTQISIELRYTKECNKELYVFFLSADWFFDSNYNSKSIPYMIGLPPLADALYCDIYETPPFYHWIPPQVCNRGTALTHSACAKKTYPASKISSEGSRHRHFFTGRISGSRSTSHF